MRRKVALKMLSTVGTGVKKGQRGKEVPYCLLLLFGYKETMKEELKRGQIKGIKKERDKRRIYIQ